MEFNFSTILHQMVVFLIPAIIDLKEKKNKNMRKRNDFLKISQLKY